MTGQLPLFDAEGPSPLDHEALQVLARRLPSSLRFGTSSWSFPGWKGIVYTSSRSPSALARHGLREYARHPLLRTVGIDRSYYAPIPEIDLLRYAEQLPDGFPCCAKAPAGVTSMALLDDRGRPTATPNPDFLSPERFSVETLEPFARAFSGHAGPFIVELPPVGRQVRLSSAALCARLDRFLGALPRPFTCAVELRDAELLTPAYGDVLRAHGAGHVYNYWRAMPLPGRQADVVPPESLALVVIRLLMKPGTEYEEQRERFRPFDRLVEPDEEMRREVAGLVARAAVRPCFVLVNNKAEGSAPLTIRALAERVAAGAGG